MRLVIFVTLFPFLFLISAHAQKKGASESGKLNVKMMFLKVKKGKTEIASEGNLPIWHSDGFVVEEMRTTVENTTEAGVTTSKERTDRYTLISPNSKKLVSFLSFSDTASINRVDTIDPVFGIKGGWNFHSTKNIEFKRTPTILLDTIIAGITYKRIRYQDKTDNEKSYSIGFIRCDKPMMFSFEKQYCATLNCPMMRIESFIVGQAHPYYVMEIQYLADSLTPKEKRILDSWKIKSMKRR
jgi:hypothetical protein